MSYTYYRRYQQTTKKKSVSQFSSFVWFVVILVVVVLIVKACVGVATRFNDEKKDQGLLSVEQGEVVIKAWGEDSFKTSASSQNFLLGDEVKTGVHATATISFANHSTFSLDENTHLIFNDNSISEEDGSENLSFTLVSGRLLLEHEPNLAAPINTIVKAGLMDVQALQGKAVMQVSEVQIAVYSLSGDIDVSYVDRGPKDVVVDHQLLRAGEQSVLTAVDQEAFIRREDIALVQASTLDRNEAFMLWALGRQPLAFEEEMAVAKLAEEAPESETSLMSEEKTLVTSEVPVVPAKLSLRITSPVSPFTLSGKTGIAIEGLVNGEAERVTVQWSGSGEEYPLGLFEAGSSSFRYVADTTYGNLKEGSNRYTIRAYGKDGVVSAPVTVEVQFAK